MVYYFDDLNKIDKKTFLFLEEYLSIERRNKLDAYRYDRDKILSGLAYILLRIALFQEYGIRNIVRFEYEKYGKPFVSSPYEFHFNLSHCSEAVVCAVSNNNIGVDVQDYISPDYGLAERCLSRKELSNVNYCVNKVYFTKIWAMKESIGKYTGEGICYDLNKVDAIEKKCIDGHKTFYECFDKFVLAYTAEDEKKIVHLDLDTIIETCKQLSK